MKTKFYVLLMVILPLFTNCKKEEYRKNYDFSVLGIEEIKINEVIISIEASGLPRKNNEVFAITGTTNRNETIEYNLAIIGSYPENQDIIVTKKYEDVSILIESDIEAKSKTIIVSRNGYDEKVIYKINFMYFEETKN